MSIEQHIARASWVTAWIGLVVGQLHALARFRTEDGKEDLDLPLTAAWAKPTSRLLAPLLDWADPDIVYVTYGKVWLPVFLAMTLCAFVVVRHRMPTGFERWAWRVTLFGFVVACAAVTLSYWTQWRGEYDVRATFEHQVMVVAFGFDIVGMLLTSLGSTVLGITLLAKRSRPLLPAALLTAMLPGVLLITMVTSMGSVILPAAFAYAIWARRLPLTAAHTPESAGALR